MEIELIVIIAFYLIILLYSIILHEISHGVAALWLGDRTAKDAGRLTLEPISHMDPIGSVLLPLFLIFSGSGFVFGWAKPVPYNPLYLTWKRWGEVAVAFAGPATNFTLALIAGLLGALIQLAPGVKQEIIYALARVTSGDIVGLVAGDIGAIFYAICVMIIFWNVLLGVFNLIPLPPLDGSKLLYALFPVPLHVKMFLEKWGFAIIILLLLTPLSLPFRVALGFLWQVFYNISM